MWKKSFISTILFNVMFIQAAFSKYIETSLESIEDKAVLEAYTYIDQSFKQLANNAVKMALPYIMEANEHLNLTSDCKNELLYLISEIRKFKLSAIHMLDASGKIPSGTLMGNSHMMGNYDECLSTTFKRKDGRTVFDGQYCMLHVKPMLPKKREGLALRFATQNVVNEMKNPSELFEVYAQSMSIFYLAPLQFGVCIPSGCTFDDMELIVQHISQKIYLNGTVAYCSKRGEISFPTGRIIAISAFSLIGLLLIIGTFLDYYSTAKNMKTQAITTKFLLCFSVLRNFPKLTNTKISENSMTCLNGIRILSLFYVILAHEYYTIYRTKVTGNALTYLNAIPTFFFQIILNNVLTVDVFFFLGGLLHCYLRMKMQKITFIQVIIHRLWRMYPTYIFGILIIYLLQAVGPFGGLYKQEYANLCDKNWWTNMLFINNYFPIEELCAAHTWYIAADMQLFLLSLFTVPVFFKNPKRGILLNLGMIVIGICSTVVWVMQKREMPSVLLVNWDPDEYNRYMAFYFTIIPHIATYFAGIILGYILYEKRDLNMSKITLFIGWTLSTTAFLSMLFITKRWNNGIEYTPTESSLYYAFSRLLYVCAVGWMILCCVTGHGGIINYILSLKIWIPLCRLSYMMYVLSYTLQMFYITNVKSIADAHHMAMIWRYAADITIICLMSLAMGLAVESPFIAMEKLIFHRKTSEEKTKANECIIKENITLESHWNDSDNPIGNHDATYKTEKFNYETDIGGRNNSGFQDINPKSSNSEMKT